jgi:dipeptidyl-peptidase-3
MKRIILAGLVATMILPSCGGENHSTEKVEKHAENKSEFNHLAEQFADLKIVRYQIPGWEKLTLKQKKLVYFLTQSGLAGRDMMWDQNYRYNLAIRTALESIINNYNGNKESTDWNNFLTYTKRVWFSNGIHHHYSNDKLKPEFSRQFLNGLLSETNTDLNADALDAMFNNSDMKKVNLDPDKGLVLGSAINFYDADITEAEVDAYYQSVIDKTDDTPLSYGLNTKVIRNKDGQLTEAAYKIGGLYGAALEKVVFWLEKAKEVAENEDQAQALAYLIGFYQTGDLELWDKFNIKWVATEGDIDFIHGFVEVYNDPKGYKGSYEVITQITDFDASARMKVLQDNVQWFEDNAPLMDNHKKANVTGVTYKVVNVAGEAGDASPSTPIGVNLPNANWIRTNHGSKSVSLGNIVSAYAGASGSGALEEFALNEEEIARAKAHGKIADKLHTALHEVVGHASGQIEKGVGTPKETLKNYASTLEEGRADLIALYYLMDEKLVELGLMESLEVGKESYDSYIRNGMMLQLRRLNVGDDIEEAHMRNRQWISKWVFEKGAADNVIEQRVIDGKTFFVVNDYKKLQVLFGELLREVQRIKSQGDYEAGKALVENYGVKVDQAIHAEVLKRSEKLKSAPYGGFINPELVPETDADGNITDVKVTYPSDFTQQMLDYGKKYSTLK